MVVVGAAFAVPIVIVAVGLAGLTMMVVLFGIILAAPPVRTAFATGSAPELVGALKRMAGAELVYALLMTAGLLVS
jgi:1,4-dihydroxy-2-naphthoate octaprenyltransferase